MSSARRGDFTRPEQSVAAVLPNGLEQPIPALTRGILLHHNERLVHESRQQIQDVLLLDPVVRTDLLGGFERPCAGENGEAREQDALSRREQLVTPVHGGFQRALAGRASADDARRFTGHMLMESARMSTEDGLVMQFHPGSYRNHNAQIWERFGPDVVLAASFQDCVLIDLAMQVAPEIEVVFLDTQYHFAETLWYVEQVRERYDLNLNVVTPGVNPDNLWVHDPDSCCAARKVEPLQRALEGKAAELVSRTEKG